MKNTKDVPHLLELQRIQKILSDDYKYNSISQCLHTNEEAADLLAKFNTKLEGYYKDLEILEGKIAQKSIFSKKDVVDSAFFKSIKKNDFFLYEDFKISDFLKGSFFTKAKDKSERLSALIYSPFSVNFFSHSLRSVFNEYFTGKPIPTDLDELQQIVSQIGPKLLENIQYCPSFVRDLFHTNFSDGKKTYTPSQLFDDYVLERIFENPYFFSILDFQQKYTAKKQDLDRLKNAIKGTFNIETILSTDTLELFPDSLKISPKSPKNPFSQLMIVDFRTLLKKGKKIPDQISSELLDKPFYEQIKSLLVTKGDSTQEQLFKNINEHLKRKEKKDVAKNFILERLKVIEFEVRLKELSYMVNKALFNLKGCLIIHLDPELFNMNYQQFIDDPSLFLETISKRIKQDEESDSVDELTMSTINANKNDPIFLITVLLSQMTLKEFVFKRPGLKMAETAYELDLDRHKDDPEYQYEPLIDMIQNDPQVFKQISSEFLSAFSDNQDPYSMLRSISRSYTSVYEKMKLYINPDSENVKKIKIPKEDEVKFMMCLLLNVRPPNVFSTYIYLYEYFLSERHQSTLFNGVNNYHIKTVTKIFNEFMKIENRSDLKVIGNYAKVCCRSVRMILKDDEEVLNKLAEVISCGDSNEEEIYKRTFNYIRSKSIKVNDKRQFSFRVISNDLSIVWLCNVLDLSNDEFDDIPLDSYDELVMFLDDSLEEEEKID